MWTRRCRERFNRNGGSLIEWAIAQSGLDDPMSRFNRHELEQFFDRWSWERDRTLARTLEECRKAGDPIDILIKQAPPAARRGLNIKSSLSRREIKPWSTPKRLIINAAE